MRSYLIVGCRVIVPQDRFNHGGMFVERFPHKLGIMLGDLPLGAAVSLFMVPVLAIVAIFILRNIRKRVAQI